MLYIELLFIVVAIIIFYLAAVLIFTPYEEDDKYIFTIIKMGYKIHLKATKKNGILKKIIDLGAKFLLILVYFILKDRKYTDSFETPDQDQEAN